MPVGSTPWCPLLTDCSLDASELGACARLSLARLHAANVFRLRMGHGAGRTVTSPLWEVVPFRPFLYSSTIIYSAHLRITCPTVSHSICCEGPLLQSLHSPRKSRNFYFKISLAIHGLIFSFGISWMFFMHMELGSGRPNPALYAVSLCDGDIYSR